MPLDPTKVALAVNSGLSVVCATCEHFWAAQDRGSESCGQRCGGPMSGGAFDKYKGPITDFSKMCFRCGAPATHAVRAVGNVRVLGCCREHIEIIQQWKPASGPAVNVVILSPSGDAATDDLPAVPTRIKLRIV